MRLQSNGKLRFSWSGAGKAQECQRKAGLYYGQGIEKIPGADSRSRLLGTCCHDGVEAVIQYVHKTGETGNHLIQVGVHAARETLSERTLDDKKVRGDFGEMVRDTEYYDMIDDVYQTIGDVLEYHIPELGIGERYRPVAESEFFENGSDRAATEVEFLVDVTDNEQFGGYVDAIMYDTLYKELVIFDWKFRGRFYSAYHIELDEQLFSYAWALNSLGLNVRRVIQRQMRSYPPKPARINKNGKPSVASQSTTWEHWKKTLPMTLKDRWTQEDYDHYYHELVEKRDNLKDPTFFIQEIELVSSPESLDHSRRQLEAQAENVRRVWEKWESVDDIRDMPAKLSARGCSFCDYVEICSTLRDSTHLDELLEEKFQEVTRDDDDHEPYTEEDMYE